MIVLGSFEASSINFGSAEPSRDDMRLVTRLIGGSLAGEERWSSIKRLCVIASANGCLAVRTALATIGGLCPDDVDEFTKAVGVPLGREMNDEAFGKVIERARTARANGDYESFTTLVASVGIYPPELSDTIGAEPALADTQPNSALLFLTEQS